MRARFGIWRALVVCCAAIAALPACDDEGEALLVLVGPSSRALRGVWTGFARISDVPPAIGGATLTGSTTVTFPVALDLGHDDRFVLRTVGFATSSGQLDGDRTCAGLYALRGRYIEFFPNEACRALPLHRYTIGGAVPGGLVLTSVPFFGPEWPREPRIEVVMRLDRAASFDPFFKH